MMFILPYSLDFGEMLEQFQSHELDHVTLQLPYLDPLCLPLEKRTSTANDNLQPY